MKIINQTPEEMTLSHPSTIQTVIGSLLTLMSGALFILSATGAPDALLISQSAFVFFGIGLFVLFTNATHIIDINKTTGTISSKQRAFMHAERETHPVATADHVALGAPEGAQQKRKAFLVFQDGTRILIDHEHRAETETSNAARVAQFLGIAIADPSKTARPEPHTE